MDREAIIDAFAALNLNDGVLAESFEDRRAGIRYQMHKEWISRAVDSEISYNNPFKVGDWV